MADLPRLIGGDQAKERGIVEPGYHEVRGHEARSGAVLVRHGHGKRA
jgi:hypothetical protein